MPKANIATLRSELARLLGEVEKGREVEIQRRNVVIAKIVPVRGFRKNLTQIGSGKGTVKIHGDVTEPGIPKAQWKMLR